MTVGKELERLTTKELELENHYCICDELRVSKPF